MSNRILVWIYRRCFLWRFCLELAAWRPRQAGETWKEAFRLAYKLARLTPEEYRQMEAHMQMADEMGVL